MNSLFEIDIVEINQLEFWAKAGTRFSRSYRGCPACRITQFQLELCSATEGRLVCFIFVKVR